MERGVPGSGTMPRYLTTPRLGTLGTCYSGRPAQHHPGTEHVYGFRPVEYYRRTWTKTTTVKTLPSFWRLICFLMMLLLRSSASQSCKSPQQTNADRQWVGEFASNTYPRHVVAQQLSDHGARTWPEDVSSSLAPRDGREGFMLWFYFVLFLRGCSIPLRRCCRQR